MLSEPRLSKEGIHTEGMRNWRQGWSLSRGGQRCPRAEWEPKKDKKNIFKECLLWCWWKSSSRDRDSPWRKTLAGVLETNKRGERGSYSEGYQSSRKRSRVSLQREIGSVRPSVVRSCPRSATWNMESELRQREGGSHTGEDLSVGRPAE